MTFWTENTNTCRMKDLFLSKHGFLLTSESANHEAGTRFVHEAFCSPILVLIDGRKVWILAIRIRSWLQAAEMRFLCCFAGLTLLDRVRTTWVLRVQPLLVWTEKTQLMWFRYITRWPMITYSWPGNVWGSQMRSLDWSKSSSYLPIP